MEYVGIFVILTCLIGLFFCGFTAGCEWASKKKKDK